MNSAGSNAVFRAPIKKSSAEISRPPRSDFANTFPCTATRARGNSPLGSAWAIEPQTVPRLRITRCAIQGITALRIGFFGFFTSQSSSADCVTWAETVIPPRLRSMAPSSSIPEMSINRDGCATRIASIGVSVCPPAIIRDS